MSKLEKATRIIFDVACILFILIAPTFLLRIMGFERMCEKND